MSSVDNVSRRMFLKSCAVGAIAVPLVWLANGPVQADQAPLISTDDPTAKALKYVEDASKAEGAKPGSTCANCMFYQGAAGADQGPCTVFGGKHVKAAGWCASWAVKS